MKNDRVCGPCMHGKINKVVSIEYGTGMDKYSQQ